MNKVQKTGLTGGIILFFIILFFVDLSPDNFKITLLAASAALMAVWWMTEAIPLAATSLIPIILFPLLGISKGESVAGAYINSTIFLFLGGFILAIVMEDVQLHRRIALRVITIAGSSFSSIIYGIMASTAFISMWISNTATAVMMLPIGLSIILKLEEQYGREKMKNFSTALMLAIAYSCSIGGIGTLIGTPPNLALVRILKITYPSAPEISFGSWMLLAVPIMLLMLITAALLLTKVFFRTDKEVKLTSTFIKEEYSKLDRMSFEEKVIALVFSLAAFLWVFRVDLNVGFIVIPGWSHLINYPEYINDGTVAMAAALSLFFIPLKNKTEGRRMMADTTIFNRVPWSIILLFGGGFALAEAFTTTGLSGYIGNSLLGLSGLSVFSMLFLISISVNFLTELTSNTAVANMILPISASISTAMGINPLLLMISVALASSMAFMLPVGTPPNTIVFSSERVRISQMARTGFLLNILTTLIICALVYTLGAILFDIHNFPGWARIIK